MMAGALALALVLPMGAAAAPKRDRALEAALAGHIDILASDDFGGRMPGTPGEDRTLAYLARQWQAVGLQSGTNDPGNPWFSPVTLTRIEPAAARARFMRKGRTIDVPASEVLLYTDGPRSLVENAPMVLVGGWEEAVSPSEVAGRVAILLDSTGATRDARARLFEAGAAAVLTVLDGSRDADAVRAERARSGWSLSDAPPTGDLDGYLTRAGFIALLTGARDDPAGVLTAASRPGFHALQLTATATLEATTTRTTIETHNLIGVLPGRHPGSGAVLLLAHWDHFGTCGTDGDADRICNGAVDNASGLAALTEIARRIAAGPRPDRDVYFLATTAEEMGLLGAEAFAQNPPVPLANIVAAFNLDTIAIAPAGSPVAVIGADDPGLDAAIGQVVRAQKLKPAKAGSGAEYLERQDGWALLRHDVPAVMVSSSYADARDFGDYIASRYHTAADQPGPGIELGGAAQDVALHVALVRRFASAKLTPARPR